jgi:hypothetical protein
MRRTLAGVAVALAMLAGAAGSAAGAGVHMCGGVAFDSDSSQGAFRLVAHGASCSVARRVARAGGRAQGRSYDARGFRCRALGHGPRAIYTVRYRCTSGRRLVTFETAPAD